MYRVRLFQVAESFEKREKSQLWLVWDLGVEHTRVVNHRWRASEETGSEAREIFETRKEAVEALAEFVGSFDRWGGEVYEVGN